MIMGFNMEYFLGIKIINDIVEKWHFIDQIINLIIKKLKDKFNI